uniref:RCC1 like n=1 Tax=Gasterosteus aculeatus aculeatus TaxID=481459 RepID=G3QCE9_GASAC
MALSCVRLCTRHISSGLQVCGHATLSKSSRPQEKTSSGPVFQFVGQHKKPSHKVFVWGFSFTGALGVPSFVVPDSGRKKPRKYQLTPYRLETAEQISSAACGYGFTLIASPTKDVIKLWGMGLNKDSQLGFQRTQHSRHQSYDYVLEPSPVALPLIEPLQTKVVQVACGRAHSLILTDQEGVFSMGNNAYGQCGRRIVEDEVYSGTHIIHKLEGFDSKVTQVACGQDHSLFLTETGKVFACGWGADGQTGLGHHNVSPRPVEVGGDLSGVEVQQVSTYGDCSLAVSTDGRLYGWGNSEYLQLASVTECTQINSPRLLPLVGCGKVVQAACGGTQVAILNERTGVCVGLRHSGKRPGSLRILHPGDDPLHAVRPLGVQPLGRRRQRAVWTQPFRCSDGCRRALCVGEEHERLFGHRQEGRPVLPVEGDGAWSGGGRSVWCRPHGGAGEVPPVSCSVPAVDERFGCFG